MTKQFSLSCRPPATPHPSLPSSRHGGVPSSGANTLVWTTLSGRSCMGHHPDARLVTTAEILDDMYCTLYVHNGAYYIVISVYRVYMHVLRMPSRSKSGGPGASERTKAGSIGQVAVAGGTGTYLPSSPGFRLAAAHAASFAFRLQQIARFSDSGAAARAGAESTTFEVCVCVCTYVCTMYVRTEYIGHLHADAPRAATMKN